MPYAHRGYKLSGISFVTLSSRKLFLSNSNLPSFFFTNYQPRQCNASYKRDFIIVLKFKWHNVLQTCHTRICIPSACHLVDSDFTNDEFLGHYLIHDPMHTINSFTSCKVKYANSHQSPGCTYKTIDQGKYFE